MFAISIPITSASLQVCVAETALRILDYSFRASSRAVRAVELPQGCANQILPEDSFKA